MEPGFTGIYGDTLRRHRKSDPAIPPARRKAGDMTHSVALINACKPFHWKDEFPPSNTPSPEIARKAKEKFGWLLNGGSGV
jgi:hypothetical protein